MRQRRAKPVRITLDLADASQVRAIRKRLRISEAELTHIVNKIGNSISAVTKEVALQRAGRLLEPAKITVAAVVASGSVTEATVTETADSDLKAKDCSQTEAKFFTPDKTTPRSIAGG